MSYVGNTPFTAAFLTDQFSGNGLSLTFTMSVAPATPSSILVSISGVLQDPSTYAVLGTTLTFSAAPPTGITNISVRHLGIPASGVTTTAYRTVTDTTATAGQTTFSIPSYTVGYINVYRNGSRLAASDYTATSGTSVVLVNGASAGDTITTESFYVSSVLNALPTTGGSISGQLTVNSATGQKPLIAQVNGTQVFEVASTGEQVYTKSTLAQYNWTGFNPSNLVGTPTNAPATGTAYDNNYVTMSNSSGTLTTTFDIAGSYFVTVSVQTQHAQAYSLELTYNTLGGTATKASPRNVIPFYGVDSNDSDTSISYSFLVTATAGQTITILPAYYLTGGGTTAQHVCYPFASFLYCGG